MQSHRIDVHLEGAEARELRAHAFLGAPYFRFWLRHPLASFVFVGVSFFGGKWAVERFLRVPFVEALIPLGVAVAGLAFLLWWVLTRGGAQHRCRSYSLELGPEGVRSRCRHGEHLTAWDEIESLAETPRLILFQLREGSPIGFPKRYLGEGANIQTAAALLRSARSWMP